MSFTRFNFGVTVENLQIEDDDDDFCPPPPSMPPSISQYFGDGPLKNKSYFLAKPITFDNNRIIFSFYNTDFFFRPNFSNDGLNVRVYFLPSSISKLDDVELNWVEDEPGLCVYDYDIDATPYLQSEFFTIWGVNGNDTVDAEIRNIGNYTGSNGIRLFVSVRRTYAMNAYAMNAWLGSFYIE
jgi:hypothetical protein